MTEKNLEHLFHETLKDVYYAEKKILKGLTKMEKLCQSRELKGAFRKHYMETEDQIERLEQVFDVLGKRPQGKTCDAIIGLIKEAESIIEEFKNSEALDAGLIGCAQSIEHYEMARYGTLACWAQQLGLHKAEKLLKETLDEETKTDKNLTELAESGVNEKAQHRRAA